MKKIQFVGGYYDGRVQRLPEPLPLTIVIPCPPAWVIAGETDTEAFESAYIDVHYEQDLYEPYIYRPVENLNKF